MEVHENAKATIAEPKSQDLTQEKVQFGELTAELEAAHAEWKSAEQSARDYKDQRLSDLEAGRNAAGQKYQLLLEKFAEARERLREKGIFCG